MRVALSYSSKEVKVACREGSACVNGTADLGAVCHVQIWTKLQRDVRQIALNSDWHHPLEGAAGSKTRDVDNEYDAIATAVLTRCGSQRRQRARGRSHAGATTRLVLMDLPLNSSSCCLWYITKVDCIDVLALLVVLVLPTLVLPHPFQSAGCILRDSWIVLIGANNVI
jgi:hypothetical protein